jgi:hypothetical protein
MSNAQIGDVLNAEPADVAAPILFPAPEPEQPLPPAA